MALLCYVYNQSVCIFPDVSYHLPAKICDRCSNMSADHKTSSDSDILMAWVLKYSVLGYDAM
jgi:hypothetical protein